MIVPSFLVVNWKLFDVMKTIEAITSTGLLSMPALIIPVRRVVLHFPTCYHRCPLGQSLGTNKQKNKTKRKARDWGGQTDRQTQKWGKRRLRMSSIKFNLKYIDLHYAWPQSRNEKLFRWCHSYHPSRVFPTVETLMFSVLASWLCSLEQKPASQNILIGRVFSVHITSMHQRNEGTGLVQKATPSS